MSMLDWIKQDRLIDGKPLAPIEDTDDIWNACSWSDSDSSKLYQCKRIPSLFKHVILAVGMEQGLIKKR